MRGGEGGTIVGYSGRGPADFVLGTHWKSVYRAPVADQSKNRGRGGVVQISWPSQERGIVEEEDNHWWLHSNSELAEWI